MPRVALILKVVPTEPMKLAGALVRHGLSSGQAMNVIRILAQRDVEVTLTGTLHELNTSFNPHGLVVQERRLLPGVQDDSSIEPIEAAAE